MIITPDKIERVAGGIVVVDVSGQMPKHKFRRYPRRQKKISKLYFHKSGRLGAPGLQGAINSARYCVTHRKVKNSPIPGWAGMPYTFWINFHPVYLEQIAEIDVFDSNWELEPEAWVFFRCQPDHLRTWHTGGLANQIGVSACFQGTGEISDFQFEVAEALIPWAKERYKLRLPSGLSWHSDRSKWGPPKVKPVCPGPMAVKWLEDYRANC